MQGIATIALIAIFGGILLVFIVALARDFFKNFWEHVYNFTGIAGAIGILVTIGCLFSYANGTKGNEDLNRIFVIALSGTAISLFIYLIAEKRR